MKTERRMLLAFLLNLAFACFEFVGGIFTGSVAILSDALHDLGDAAGIGVSYALERKSGGQPEGTYTYGYGRYSVLGGVLTALILLVGSLVVIGHALPRLMHPTQIRYDGMILFALVGVCVNGAAAFLTRKGESINQRAVNLHMLEDVLGWAVVLVGAVVMRFTGLAVLDPILSIGVALFIGVNGVRCLKEGVDIFLEKAPDDLDRAALEHHLFGVEGVLEVHHLHLWSLDGQQVYATMHIVSNAEPHALKELVRDTLFHHGIHHATLELETEGEPCTEPHCHIEAHCAHAHHHHHHH